MKISLDELKRIVAETIMEAKKSKKSKKKDEEEKGNPFDFSVPLGELNLYKKQGASNFGPYTAEGALRLAVAKMISEALEDLKLQPLDQDKTKVSGPYTDRVVSKNAKDSVICAADKKWDKGGKSRNPWEEASRWYDVKKPRKKSDCE